MRCLNPRCGRELRDDWAFCDRCGADNRPPAARTKVVEDEHDVVDGEFCVRCGVSILDAHGTEDDEENLLRVWGGWAALIVGAAGLTFSTLVRRANQPRVGEEPSRAYEWAYVAGRYGSYLLAAGVILLLITPTLKKRRRSGP